MKHFLLITLFLGCTGLFAQNNTIFYGGSGQGYSRTCIPLPIILPIELVDFNATCTGNFVSAEWIVASENDNREYQIEYSADGKTWQLAGSVEAIGNSSFETSYHLSFQLPGFSSYYLKLCQVDFDGNKQCFDIISISSCADVDEIVVFPNPSTGELNLVIPARVESASLSVTTSVGQVIFADQITQSGVVNYPMDHIPAGIYQIKLMSGEEVLSITSWVKI